MTLDLANLPDKIYVKPHGLPAPTNGLGTFYGTNWGKSEKVEYVRRYSLPLTQVELSKFREDHPLDGPALVALAAWVNVKPNQLPKEMQAHNCPDTMAAWGRVAQALKKYYGDPRMTFDLAKLRAETLALIHGATPGPWIFYADLPSVEPDWHIVTTKNRLRVLANVHIEPGNVADNANARLIAAAPTLAADTLRLLDEIERLRAVLERIETASRHWADYEAAPDAVHYAHESTARLARAALAEGGPDDR